MKSVLTTIITGATRLSGNMTCKGAERTSGTLQTCVFLSAVAFSGYSSGSRRDHHLSQSVLVCSFPNWQEHDLEFLVRISLSISQSIKLYLYSTFSTMLNRHLPSQQSSHSRFKTGSFHDMQKLQTQREWPVSTSAAIQWITFPPVLLFMK